MLSAIDILVLTRIKYVKKEVLYTVIHSIYFNPGNSTELHEIIIEKLNKSWPLGETKKLYAWATEEIQSAKAKNIQVITILDLLFPNKLKNIPNPPIILFVKGNAFLLQDPFSVAVVGTREPSQYGSEFAKKLSADLAKQGIVIVSGLALGCDTQAHLGCLSSNGKTIAVMAHGLEYIFPTENISLAEEILEKGGCLISEYAPSIKPKSSQFIQRNRIQSGLSQATLIIECKKKSGTMTTAKHSIEQKRLLYCLQGESNGNMTHFEGNNLLIHKEGAIPVDPNNEMLLISMIAKIKAYDFTESHTKLESKSYEDQDGEADLSSDVEQEKPTSVTNETIVIKDPKELVSIMQNNFNYSRPINVRRRYGDYTQRNLPKNVENFALDNNDFPSLK